MPTLMVDRFGACSRSPAPTRINCAELRLEVSLLLIANGTNDDALISVADWPLQQRRRTPAFENFSPRIACRAGCALAIGTANPGQYPKTQITGAWRRSHDTIQAAPRSSEETSRRYTPSLSLYGSVHRSAGPFQASARSAKRGLRLSSQIPNVLPRARIRIPRHRQPAHAR